MTTPLRGPLLVHYHEIVHREAEGVCDGFDSAGQTVKSTRLDGVDRLRSLPDHLRKVRLGPSPLDSGFNDFLNSVCHTLRLEHSKYDVKNFFQPK